MTTNTIGISRLSTQEMDLVKRSGKSALCEIHSVEFLFPDRDQEGQHMFINGELVVEYIGQSSKKQVHSISLMDDSPFPPGWTEKDTNLLKKCCDVFCQGELSHAVLSVELDNGIKVERIEAKI